MPQDLPKWWLGKISPGDGLVPLGNRPLPDLMFTQICVPK